MAESRPFIKVDNSKMRIGGDKNTATITTTLKDIDGSAKNLDNSELNIDGDNNTTTISTDFQGIGTASENPGTKLPPIGIFWDIENCQVPKGKSAFDVANRIRDKYCAGSSLVEFVCVCDTSKENREVEYELGEAQVKILHVSATSKNAADNKLVQLLRDFGENHSQPGTVLLISGDGIFKQVLSDLKYRCGFKTVVLHNKTVSKELLAFADDHCVFSELFDDLPERQPKKSSSSPVELLVTNLPTRPPDATPDKHAHNLRKRLNQLFDNRGGKVKNLDPDKCSAIMTLPNYDDAQRACTTMTGEDVFNSKINVDFAPAE
ncbi:meiosis regulator and mRNA stability factor 1-like [Tubulanus polymorphus]|uniref:meiosis regulator and mRNA stability factor 1-like n=1 Tax=Tubulanus polymorphus TaxID=672921 RepID=UPI003DA2C186